MQGIQCIGCIQVRQERLLEDIQKVGHMGCLSSTSHLHCPLEFHLEGCIRACIHITEVYESSLGTNALNGCRDMVNADNEIFGLIMWIAVLLLLLHFICFHKLWLDL